MDLANKTKKAQSLVEYALIMALVAAVAMVVMQQMATEVSQAGLSAASSVNTTSNSANEAWCTSIGGTFSNNTCVPPTN